MRVRPTARLLVLDPANRILLFKIAEHDLSNPMNPDRPTTFWITPGGGVEDGESVEDAALRELREETGIHLTRVERKVAERGTFLRERDQDILFQTTFLLARSPTCDVTLQGLTAVERAAHRDHRWWSLDELERTSETVFPEDLPLMLRGLFEGS